MPSTGVPANNEDESPIQRLSTDVTPVQRLCSGCDSPDGSSLQRKSGEGGATRPSPSVHRAVTSPGAGSPLSDPLRRRVEPVVGADLAGVRVHSGALSRRAAGEIQAKAFTHKNNIHLGEGQSAQDVGLMAHELTHVVQQRAAPASSTVQRRIVMRTLTPEERSIPLLGNVQLGTRENLRTVTDEEVENYINGIGTVYHEYDDIISGRGEAFGFVSDESYRRNLIVSIIRNLHHVTTPFYFDGYQEAVREIRKRTLISLFMRASQGRTRGSRPTGYPRSCGVDPGPRVSQAAGSYWIVHPSSGGNSYWFELSDEGRNNAYEALRTLIFNHQSSACLRTLMHCDYMISAQQFFVMADTIGEADFNQSVRNGEVNLEIRWNSYENIVADTATAPGAYQSLQTVELNSENDFVIGDHVIFFNHDAFDDMNQVHRNVRGNYSNWRLENAIVTDMDASGGFRFQGHGYFRPKPRSAFVHAMVGKMNDLVDAAQSAMSAGNTSDLGFTYGDGSRFEVVRSDGHDWNIHYHEGLGTGAGLPAASMPLRRFAVTDFPNPFAAPGESTIRVRRPIESRRESLGEPATTGGGSGSGATSPFPMPSAPSTTVHEPAPEPTSIPETPMPGLPEPTGIAPVPNGHRTGTTGAQQPQAGHQQTPAHPETPTSPCPYICTSRQFLGARKPHYKSGDDFKYYDFPSLTTWETLKVAPFRPMSDSLLEFGMNNVLGFLAGSDGRGMVSHFRGGSGTPWTHGVGSRLNREATHCPSVNGAVSMVHRQLAAQARAMRSLDQVDCRAFSLDPVPVFHFDRNDSLALKGIIGGTQGLAVYLDVMRLKDPATCRYELDLQLVVFDDFGVDTDDLYWPALIKFWILQHERLGNRPFVNILLINRTIVV